MKKLPAKKIIVREIKRNLENGRTRFVKTSNVIYFIVLLARKKEENWKTSLAIRKSYKKFSACLRQHYVSKSIRFFRFGVLAFAEMGHCRLICSDFTMFVIFIAQWYGRGQYCKFISIYQFSIEIRPKKLIFGSIFGWLIH